MGKYDYERAITDAIKDWIISNDVSLEGDEDEIIDTIDDEVFMEDSITGNGVEFFDTEEKCSEYLSDNFGLLYEAVYEYNMDNDVEYIIDHYIDKSLARFFDCTIRCYLLRSCIERAVKELKGED